MKYFSLNELTRSTTADRLGIDNTPSPEIVRNLETLVDKVLDPLRAKFGKPLIVNSGYRCPELNLALKGANNSAHMKGQAADITTGTKYCNRVIFDLIKDNFVFDQLIDEKNYSWIHVAYRADGNNRKQVLHM